MKNKFVTTQEISRHYFDGMTLMYGGFMSVGTPSSLVQSILDANVKNLTIIGNDTGMIGQGISPLIENHRVKKVIASHIGTNPETGRKMIAGEIEVDLVPQGTLAERIRCGGSGLGGVLTPTGLGTVVENGKQIITENGKDYLLELPLKADVAILKAHKVDKLGNVTYKLSARNFNPLIALAAQVVIVEADEIVDVGEISPDEVMTPAALIDYILCKA